MRPSIKYRLSALLIGLSMLCLPFFAPGPIWGEELPFDLDAELNQPTAEEGAAPAPVEAEADTWIYQVPVRLMHAYENKPSMGDPALEDSARVVLQASGRSQISLRINGLHFMNMYGHVWNFFHEEDGQMRAAQVGEWQNDKNLLGEKQTFPYVFLLDRSQGKEQSIKVRVWVDAMDAIASGGAKNYADISPGKGAQNARLILDWEGASLLGSYSSEQEDVFASGSDLDAAALKDEAAQAADEDAAQAQPQSSSATSSSETEKRPSGGTTEDSDSQILGYMGTGSASDQAAATTASSGGAGRTGSEASSGPASATPLYSLLIPVLLVLGGGLVYWRKKRGVQKEK